MLFIIIVFIFIFLCVDNLDVIDIVLFNKSIKLCGDEVFFVGYKEVKLLLLDIKWIVDNFGRIFVRFISRSKIFMYRGVMIGDMKQFEESEYSSDGIDGEYDIEIKCIRTFIISSLMNRYISIGVKLSDVVY